jgi:ethanolamine utilization protein EutQ
MAGTSKQVAISSDCVLSPSAIDLARQMNIEIIRENTLYHLSAKKAASAAGNISVANRQEADNREKATDSKEALLEGDIPAIVRKVLSQVMKPACPNPRVVQVRGDSVVLERFDQAPPGQKVMMKDVVTAREGNLCAGFMSYDHSELPWRLTYDEVDYVVEGVFTVQVGDKTYTCQEGDIMYIPKNTSVVFGSPAQTKVFYVTYPANWAELQS